MPESLKDASIPSPDSEVRTKAAHKKRTPIPSQATSTPAADMKKFNWGAHKDAEAYLKERFAEMLLQDGKEWLGIKKDAVEQMLLKFDFPECNNDGNMREIGKTWFKNELQRYRARQRNAVAQSLTTPPQKLDDTPQPHIHCHQGESSTSLDELIAPLLKHVKGRASSAQNLWAAEHEDTVRERKAALGGGIGAHSTAVNQLFEALPAEERGVWEKKVVEEKLKLLKDISACFENQKNFPRVLALLIDRFIGFRADQIGAAIVFFRIAMRNKEGGIDWDQYTVGVKEGTESFTVFQGGPQQQEINRWEAYSHAYLEQNPVPRDPRFEYADDGCPKLPPYSDTWTLKDLAAALDSWLHAMWGYCREKAELELPNGLDWDVIKADPKKFIPSGWLDAEIRRPADVPFHILCALYYRFFDSQDKTHAFRWIHLQGTPAQAPNAQVAAAASSSNPVPATPSRQRRVVFSTPTATPLRTRGDSEFPSTPSKSRLPDPGPCPPPQAHAQPLPLAISPARAAPEPAGQQESADASEHIPPLLAEPTTDSVQSTADQNSVASIAAQEGSAPAALSESPDSDPSTSGLASAADAVSTSSAHEPSAPAALSESPDSDSCTSEAVASAPDAVSTSPAEAADDIPDDISTVSTLTEDSNSDRVTEASAMPLTTTSKRKEAPAVSPDSGLVGRPSKRSKRSTASVGVTLRRSSRHNTELVMTDGPTDSMSAPKATRNKGTGQNKITPTKELQSKTRVLRSRAPQQKDATKGARARK